MNAEAICQRPVTLHATSWRRMDGRSSARTSDTELRPHHEPDQKHRDGRQHEQRRMVDALIADRPEERGRERRRLVGHAAELSRGAADGELREAVCNSRIHRHEDAKYCKEPGRRSGPVAGPQSAEG